MTFYQGRRGTDSGSIQGSYARNHPRPRVESDRHYPASSPGKGTPDSSFEELGIDSMDSINILFDLESEFDIEIDDEDAKKIRTIPEMVAGVTSLVEAKESTSPKN